ncbi:MAG TPA: GNAT family N-acetyltransferase [Streptosporangiaceae bacterium]
MDGSRARVRSALGADVGAVASLAAELAQSFAFSREQFDLSYPALLASADACLLVAAEGDDCLGYVLGFRHLTFYANGPVRWVEEIVVTQQYRGRGLGRALMSAFESWAAARDCVLVALATRRAAPFYLALGYAESATYLRKILTHQAP